MGISISKWGLPIKGSPIQNRDHHIEMVIFISLSWNGAGSVTNPFWNGDHSNLRLWVMTPAFGIIPNGGPHFKMGTPIWLWVGILKNSKSGNPHSKTEFVPNRGPTYILTPWYNITWTQPYPQFPKNPSPPSEAYQCKGAPKCPSTAYQGAKTLCIYMLWMWDAVYGALQLQPWLYNITQSQSYPWFPKNPHPPSEANQCKGGPICPSTAYKGGKHFAYIIWIWVAVYGGLEGQPTDKTTRRKSTKMQFS